MRGGKQLWNMAPVDRNGFVFPLYFGYAAGAPFPERRSILSLLVHPWLDVPLAGLVSLEVSVSRPRSQCVTGLVAHLCPRLPPANALQRLTMILDEPCGIVPRFFWACRHSALSPSRRRSGEVEVVWWVPPALTPWPWPLRMSCLGRKKRAGGGGRAEQRGCGAVNIPGGQAISRHAESWKNGPGINAAAIKYCWEYLGRKFQPSFRKVSDAFVQSPPCPNSLLAFVCGGFRDVCLGNARPSGV